MQRKQIVSMLFVGAAALALNAAPVWAQAPGGSQSERGGGATDTSQGKSGSAGSTAPSEVGKGSGRASQSEAKAGQQDIRQVQEALKDQGHDPGPIDGVMGSQTSQALKEFQKANGLKQTGTLDAKTKEKLKIEGSSSGASKGSSPGAGSMGKGEGSKSQREPSSPAGK